MKYYALPNIDKHRLVATEIIKLKNRSLVSVDEIKSYARKLRQELVNFDTLKNCENFNRKRLSTALDRFYDLYREDHWETRHFAIAQQYFDDPKYVKVFPYDAIKIEKHFVGDHEKLGYSKMCFYTIAPKTFDENAKISMKEFASLSHKNKLFVVGWAHKFFDNVNEVELSEDELAHAFDHVPEIFYLFQSNKYWQTLKDDVAERFETDRNEYVNQYSKAKAVLMELAVECATHLKKKRQRTHDKTLDTAINYCENFEKILK